MAADRDNALSNLERVKHEYQAPIPHIAPLSQALQDAGTPGQRSWR
jgi:hypothetical protein